MRGIALALLCACTHLGPALAAQDVPPMERRVNDRAGFLTGDDARRIESRLEQFERETSNQLAVLIVPSLEGEPIESFSLRVAKTWRLGQRGVDNGMLVTLSTGERRIRIELGRGIARCISDAQAAEIVRYGFQPGLRDGRNAEGLQAGLERLMGQARSCRQGPLTKESKGESWRWAVL